jgi:hypothetical protein
VGDLKTHAVLQTRVGIATGLVVVGDLIGSGEARERGIVGETPNLAAKLMEELRIARDYLEAEGERIRRLTSRYVHLTKTASASVRVISESLGKWRNPEMEAVTKADAQTARIEAQVPSLPPASSLPKNEPECVQTSL